MRFQLPCSHLGLLVGSSPTLVVSDFLDVPSVSSFSSSVSSFKSPPSSKSFLNASDSGLSRTVSAPVISALSFCHSNSTPEYDSFNFPDFSPIPNEKIFFPKLTIDLPIFFTLSIVPETKSPIPFQTSVITLTPF